MTPSDRLVCALHAGTLVAVVAELRTADAGLSPDDRRLVDAAAVALEAIGAEGVDAYRALAAALDGAGVRHRPLGPLAEAVDAARPALSRIAIDVGVDGTEAGDAVAVARALGYRSWYRLHRGAWDAYRRLYPALPLVAETPSGHPVLLRIAWRPLDGPQAERPAAARLGRLRPTPDDLDAVDLPPWLWFGHLVLRPLRVAHDRARRRSRPVDLGPYLPTPSGLIDPLLDGAEVGADDVVADLGCGDGRILVHAAATRGCRALGVERDPLLIERARANAVAAGVNDRVVFTCGEVDGLAVGGASVVILFLAAATLADLVTDLRSRLRPGSRILAHEQAALPVQGDRRWPIFTPAGITVAHRWDV